MGKVEKYEKLNVPGLWFVVRWFGLSVFCLTTVSGWRINSRLANNASVM